MPMATPMSACFRAGASLTPSPVMATRCPRSCQARRCGSCAPGHPGIHADPGYELPQFLIAHGLNNGTLHGLGAGGEDADLLGDGGGGDLVVAGNHDGPDTGGDALTDGRLGLLLGGSIMAMRPRNWRSFSSSRPMAGRSASACRRPAPAGPAGTAPRSSARSPPSPPGERRVRPSITSTAPLVSMVRPSGNWWTVLISFRSESKGAPPDGDTCPAPPPRRSRSSRPGAPGRSLWGLPPPGFVHRGVAA